LIVAAGLAANPWVLGALFSGDGRIDSPYTRGLILTFDAYMVLVGLYLVGGGRLARLPGLLAFVTLNLVVFGEIALRVADNGPWVPPDIGVTVEPGGRFFEADPDLGYRMLPGTFDVTLTNPELDTDYHFSVTHGEDGMRLTRPADAPAPGGEGAVWALGCSFTHGWTVDDDEAWPSRLQQALPANEVLNLGVDGYGTLQSLLLLRARLEQSSEPPAAVVLAYASFHDHRNTFARLRRKEAAPANSLGPLLQPFARLAPDGSLDVAMADVIYTEAPLMRVSAVAHALEKTWNHLEETRVKGALVSWVLIVQMAQACDAAGVEFVVAGIIDDDKTLAMGGLCREAGIRFVDISVDLTDPALTNLPHDGHPSAAAHARYAKTLGAYLADGVLER
jgi:hypothetical protein